MKKQLSIISLIFLMCLCLTGCDRTAPELSGIDTTLEIDCGTELNLEDYLNENLQISDETDDGVVDYKLSDLTHSIDCDDSIYNTESGEVDTTIAGSYQVRVDVQDLKNNESSIDFTLVINPYEVSSNIEDTVTIDCGTDFNVKEYFAENITITNKDKTAEYTIDDFDYEIECDESVYYETTGVFDTERAGDFPITLLLNSDSFDTSEITFTLTLNPLVMENGYYVYEDSTSSSNYSYLGYCEYKNTSKDNLKINSIEFRYYDKDDIMISSSDMPDYSLDYLTSGASGYALDTFASFDSIINSKDEIVRIDVLVDYDITTEEDTTTLTVGDFEIINNYDYNVSGFAGTTVIENPYDTDVEYFDLLAGMYDENDTLIGVVGSFDYDVIAANSKSRATVSWLPDSREIPDQVKELRGSARVTSFAE